MDSMKAFAMGEAARAAGNPTKVFDWDKAAQIIGDKNPEIASAGLSGDWKWTGGPIFKDGAPVDQDDTYTFLSSIWATPELDCDGDVVPCWRYEDDTPGWDSGTYWPESALAILNAAKAKGES